RTGQKSKRFRVARRLLRVASSVATSAGTRRLMKIDSKKDEKKVHHPQEGRAGIAARTNVKVGGPVLQHNQAKGVRVRSGIKVGGIGINHNVAKGVRVRSGVKAAGPFLQHNQAKGVRVRSA